MVRRLPAESFGPESVDYSPRDSVSMTQPHPIILFDGVCNLCNASVNFVIDRDPDASFRFGSLQSEAGQALLASHGVDERWLDSIVLLEGGEVYTASDAALRIATQLKGPWVLMHVFRLVPRPVRDAVYNWIARNRYRWFGKQETCRIPTPDLKSRFLDS